MEISEYLSQRKSSLFWAGGLSLLLHGLLAVVVGHALLPDEGNARGNNGGFSLSLAALNTQSAEAGHGSALSSESLAQPRRTAEAAPAVPQSTRLNAAEKKGREDDGPPEKLATPSVSKPVPLKKSAKPKPASVKKADARPSKNNSPRAEEKSIMPRKKQAVPSQSAVADNGTDGKNDVAAPLADSREIPGMGGVAEVPFGRACGPAFRHFSRPVYPLQARRSGISGLVKLRVSLDDAGTVRSVEVLESGHRLLADAACESIRRSSFRPYTENGKSLPSRTIIPIRFSLEQAL